MNDTSALEAIIIGECLLSTEALAVACGILQPSDFAVSTCATVYGCMRDRAVKGLATDMVSVADASGVSLAWLNQCTSDGYALPSMAEHHCRTLLEHSTRRKVWAASQEIAALAREGGKVDQTGEVEPMSASEIIGQALQKLMVAQPASASRQTALRELVPQVFGEFERRAQREDDPRCYFGMPLLDMATGGMEPGHVVIIAARTSVGKTAAAIQFAYHNAAAGKRVAFFSLEMKAHELVKRLLASQGKLPGWKLRDPKQFSTETFEKLSTAGALLTQANMDIVDHVYTVEDLILACRKMQMRGNLRMVVVDYLGLLRSHVRTSGVYERTTEISRQLKIMAGELDVPVVVLAQINRESAREGRRPELHHLRDSGAIEQDADAVLILHDSGEAYAAKLEAQGQIAEAETIRARDPAELEIHIAKNRGGERNKAILADYYKSTQRIVERG